MIALNEANIVHYPEMLRELEESAIYILNMIVDTFIPRTANNNAGFLRAGTLDVKRAGSDLKRSGSTNYRLSKSPLKPDNVFPASLARSMTPNPTVEKTKAEFNSPKRRNSIMNWIHGAISVSPGKSPIGLFNTDSGIQILNILCKKIESNSSLDGIYRISAPKTQINNLLRIINGSFCFIF